MEQSSLSPSLPPFSSSLELYLEPIGEELAFEEGEEVKGRENVRPGEAPLERLEVLGRREGGREEGREDEARGYLFLPFKPTP